MTLRLLVGVTLLFVPVGALSAEVVGTEVTIPITVKSLFTEKHLTLVGTEYRPAGSRRFPAVVLSHGSASTEEVRGKVQAKFQTAADVLVRWGLVVLTPVRRGYGRSEGTFEEDFGSCANPAYGQAGLETARDIDAAVRWLADRPYVDRERIALVGTSAGGWGSLAAASREGPPIKGVVNFAGGRGGMASNIRNNVCSPRQLVAAAGRYGKNVRVPTLWLYSENDRYFAPALAREMHQAFTRAGGRATLYILPAWGPDGHFLLEGRTAVPLWREHVRAFFREIGLLR